mmetsp:Transcript_83401/g.235087  ORF Transcript_83401/g.235087 Transcript_83401/m.235087 type:complete len:400 (+) Transcript_83401:752-1951(+)
MSPSTSRPTTTALPSPLPTPTPTKPKLKASNFDELLAAVASNARIELVGDIEVPYGGLVITGQTNLRIFSDNNATFVPMPGVTTTLLSLFAGAQVAFEGVDFEGGGSHVYSAGNGGCVLVSASELTIERGRLTECSAGGGVGGGIAAEEGSHVTMSDVLIERSSARLGGGVYAGGGSKLVMTSVVLDACESSTNGAGVTVEDAGSSLIMHSSAFKSCTVHGVHVANGDTEAYGGGLALVWASATLADTSFSYCWASRGGAIYMASASLELSRLTVHGNGEYDMYNSASDYLCTAISDAGHYTECSHVMTGLGLTIPCYANCASEASACEAGTSTEGVEDATSLDACRACSAGSVAGSGASWCETCVRGTYASDDVFDADGYGVITKASSCVDCPGAWCV